jgi:hypothetical protein
MPKYKLLKGVANNIADSFLSFIPPMQGNEKAFFHADLKSQKITPLEIETPPLKDAAKRCWAILVTDAEKAGINREEIKEATIEVNGTGNGYKSISKIIVGEKEYTGSAVYGEI